MLSGGGVFKLVARPKVAALAGALLITMSAGAAYAESAAPAARIVSTDGTTTEILYALGVGEAVVARDSGSTYPAEAAELPSIGMGHQINAEAIISYNPTLVIGKDRAMSHPGFKILESTGAKLLRLSGDANVDAAKANIQAVAEAVGKEAEAEAIIKKMDEDLAKLAEELKSLEGKPRPTVVTLYLRPGTALLLGKDSNAAAMTKLVGAEYALDIDGYTNLNPEAVVAAQPDAFLCFTAGLDAVGGVEGFLKQPGISETPGGKARRVIAMDDLLLGGFGPRTGQAALELFDALYKKEGVYVAKHDAEAGQ